MKKHTANRWRSWGFSLAAKTSVLIATLILGHCPVQAGLVLELKPSDYEAANAKWPIASGTMAGDYFACAPGAGVPPLATKINAANGLGYKALDFTANGTIFGGPLCPAEIAGSSPRTIEAWCYQPAGAGGDNQTIIDLSRQYGPDDSNFGFCNSMYGYAIQASPNSVTWTAGNAVRQGRWVHLVASYAGGPGGALNLYVDGALDKTTTHTFATEVGGSISIGMMRYGFTPTSHSTANGDGWNQYRGYLGSIRVYDEARTEAQVAADFALGVNYGEVPATVPNHTITASVTGGNGTIDPAGAISVPEGTSKTFTFLAAAGYMVDTVTVDGTAVVMPYPGLTYTFSNVAVDHTIDVSYKVDPNANTLFSLNVDALTPAEGERITTWPAAVPVGLSLPAYETWNNGLPMLGPIVETIGGIKWEQNTRANYDDTVTPTIHTRQDGFQLGGDITAPIPVNGVSVVTVVRPVRKAISDPWTSIVDVFYNKLVLGVRNDNGKVIVWRGGNSFTSAAAIPDGQKTILSLVAQPAGQFKVYANGLEVMSETSTSTLTSLVPGSGAHEKGIRVGRGYDAWTVFNGNIADTVFYKSAISESERATLEAALGTKFGITVTGPSLTATISGKVTDASVGVAGVVVTATPGGLTGTTDVNGDYTIAGATVGTAYTLTASSLPAGKLVDTAPAAFTAVATSNPGKDFTLKVDPTYDPTALFIAKSSDCTGATWPLAYPGGTMTKVGSATPGLTTVNGQQWEVNTAPGPWDNGYNPVPTGFVEASGVATPLIVNGMSVVVSIIPLNGVVAVSQRNWCPIVDVLFGCLRLGVDNVTGQIIVQRQCGDGTSYQLDHGPALDSGVPVVLSLVIQPDNSYVVYKNGVPVMTGAANGAFSFTSLSRGGYNNVCVGISTEDTGAAFSGNIGDVYVYKTALSNTARETLQNGLAAKFGITLPPVCNITTTVTGGTISPNLGGVAQVEAGSSPTFTFYSDTGVVDEVRVDGVLQAGHPQSYTFTNVSANHTLDVTFTVQTGPAANDNFADALELSSTGVQTGSNNRFATFETGEPECAYPGTTHTVWFKWTAPSDGLFTITTAGSRRLGGGLFDAIIGCFTGTAVDSLTQVVKPQDTYEVETLSNIPVAGGTTYYFQVGGDSNNQEASNIQLTWSFVSTAPTTVTLSIAPNGSGGYNITATPSTGSPTVGLYRSSNVALPNSDPAWTQVGANQALPYTWTFTPEAGQDAMFFLVK